MSATIEFLINFSILKERRYILSQQEVSLARLTEEVMRLVERRYSDRGVCLQGVENDPGTIVGDPSALRSMLHNLIENAVLHTLPGGEVTATIGRQGTTVSVSIADTGVGIDPHDLPYVFEPFYRGGTAHTQGEVRGRMGLGLCLVKEIVELHRATISVSSQVHQGTTFTVSFQTY